MGLWLFRPLKYVPIRVEEGKREEILDFDIIFPSFTIVGIYIYIAGEMTSN